MLPEKIIFVGVLINLFCTIWYIRGIFRSGTKPNLVSWFIWMLAPLIGFFLQLKAGAGLSSLGVFWAGFGPFLVIIFCLIKKSAFWKIQTFDLICGLFSVMALVLYIITNNLGVSIIFAISSDFLAYIPTYIKSWKYPETETGSTYIGGVINNTLALSIIKNWTFPIYSFPLYLVLANLTEISFLYHKKIFRKSTFS